MTTQAQQAGATAAALIGFGIDRGYAPTTQPITMEFDGDRNLRVTYFGSGHDGADFHLEVTVSPEGTETAARFRTWDATRGAMGGWYTLDSWQALHEMVAGSAAHAAEQR